MDWWGWWLVGVLSALPLFAAIVGLWLWLAPWIALAIPFRRGPAPGPPDPKRQPDLPPAHV